MYKRTPTILQLEVAECGAACLGIVLAHYGRWESLENLREVCGVSRDGSTAGDLANAARQYGLKVTALRREPRQLEKLPVPAVLFWEFNHFVVFEGFHRGRYYLNDPANGRRTVTEENFDTQFTGIAMTLEPGPEFRPGGVKPSVLRRIWPWLRDAKATLAFALGCGLLLALPSLALPVLLSVFVDHVLGGAEPDWAGVLVSSTVAAAGLVYLLTWLQQRSLRRLAVYLSVVHADRFLSHLLRLPVRFFASRFSGSLTERAKLVDQVAAMGTAQFTGVLIELVLSVIFLALMLVYDPLLASIVAAIGGASVVLMRVVGRLRTDENRQMRREQDELAGIGMFGLRSIDSLRSTATEDDFLDSWSGHLACELAARQRFSELGRVTESLPGLFLILGSAVVLGLGGWRVMSGDMTLGMLMGFYVVAGNFLRPIGRFVQFADLFKMMEADLQRLDDILDTPEEPGLAAEPDVKLASLKGRLRLSGRIELREITFGYRRQGAPLIDGFNLKIEPGQRVAVIGPSGSGKSTLVTLMSGVYAPWSGEILFDDVLSSEIPRPILTNSVAVVSQSPFLFAGTVRDNLTLWNPTIPDHDMVAAARDAAIHEEIMARPLGYDAVMEEQGGNFSGGQRQRLEIARALACNPSLLLLDEATSALDALTEEQVDDALRRRGVTCLIVAHRLSTIRDCDQIVVLDRGREVQRGVHETLEAEPEGLYRRLLQSY